MEYEQRPFGDPDLVDNPENRCPVLLLLDTSGSMQGQPIKELNAGLEVFRDELFADSLAAKRVEVSIVTFGPVQTIVDFTGLQTFSPPQLVASGDTPMGRAIEQGLELLSDRKKAYRDNGIAFYRPWVFLITDGGPTDSIVRAKELITAGEASKSFSVFAVGVEGANFEVLKSLSPVREPLRLQGLRFRDLFQWLSASLSSVSRSQPGDQVPLPTPTGWATVG
jgi:uncharacterized protein YegL